MPHIKNKTSIKIELTDDQSYHYPHWTWVGTTYQAPSLLCEESCPANSKVIVRSSKVGFFFTIVKQQCSLALIFIEPTDYVLKINQEHFSMKNYKYSIMLFSTQCKLFDITYYLHN